MQGYGLQLAVPSALSLTGDVATNWKTFKQRWEFYCEASGATEYGAKRKACLLLHIIGEDAVKVYNNFTFTDEEDKFDDANILTKFDAYCNPKKNETFERHKFFTRSQHVGESIEQFANALRTLTKTCDFGTITDSLIRDRLICGVADKNLRERLLRREDLTLAKALTMGRISEETSSGMKTLTSADSVDIHQNTEVSSDVGTNNLSATGSNNEIAQVRRGGGSGNYIHNCFFCKRNHVRRRCPAFGKTCSKCNRKNHTEGSEACKKQSSNINSIELPHNDEDAMFFVATIQDGDKKNQNNIKKEDKWTVNLGINGTLINFYLDSGAQANVLSYDQYCLLNPLPEIKTTRSKLLSYSGKIETLGYISAKIVHEKQPYQLDFYIVKNPGRALLGLDSCLAMNLISRVEHNRQVHRLEEIISRREIIDRQKVEDTLNEFRDVFEGVGRLPGEYHITVDNSLPRIHHASRRFPLPLMPKLRKELDRMIDAGIIESVTEPTHVCSSMVAVEKPGTGDLRICLDAPELNNHILRENTQIPTKEEVHSKFVGAKVFSKIDASAAFWHLKLDKESSDLCTFNTPYGRYKYLVMPYGIKSASEIFHRELRNLFEGVEGVENIHDDIVIYTKTVKEHMEKVKQVLTILRKKGLRLNRPKCLIGVSRILFFCLIFIN